MGGAEQNYCLIRSKILAIDWNQEEAFDVFGSWMIGNESEFDFGLSFVVIHH